MRTPNTINKEYPGAKGMVVGDLMFNILTSVHSLYEKYSTKGKKVILLPAYTNFWLKKDYKNPLPVIWLVGTDIVGESLIQRILKDIEQLKSGDIFILDNFDGLSLHRQPNHEQKLIKPVKNLDSIVKRVLNYISSKSRIIERNEYFIVYEKN